MKRAYNNFKQRNNYKTNKNIGKILISPIRNLKYGCEIYHTDKKNLQLKFIYQKNTQIKLYVS